VKPLSEKLAGLSEAQLRVLRGRLTGGTHTAPVNSSATSGDGLFTQARPQKNGAGRGAGLQFSLFFFSDDGTKADENKYSLLLESAKYADAHGFTAVWTPERHFQGFGGLYPNPSVIGAYLAGVTRRVQIRAGSVALPLHHPIRVAEEWALVDNLSNGRVGVSFASGWHPADFILSPSTYLNRKETMYRHIQTIKKLWAGEAVDFVGHDGRQTQARIFPRPVQEKLPVWITTSGSKETWARAGEIGANILTGIRVDPFGDLTEKISLYRAALATNGHDPRDGKVTVMLHTFLGDDVEAVKEKVKPALTGYLRTFMAQGEHLDAKQLGLDPRAMTEADKSTLAQRAFDRFFDTASLLGTPQKCIAFIERLKDVGVDEIACLVDFGLDEATVLGGLDRLNELRQQYCRPVGMRVNSNGDH
jgi:natural product biosynthesis luciferase-like monooxygenase protein